MPVRRDPPQTHLLRAFEAVARLKSFKQAAVEIGVSQSAVSQRVAALEARLDTCLIHRDHGRFELTRDGLAYLATAEGVLRTLARADNRLADRRDTVRMTVVSSFAHCWLAPRLESLSQSFEDICLDLHVSDEIVAIDEGEYDLAIRLHPRAGIPGERMTATDDVLIPVHAPGSRASRAGRPDPFDGMRLLEDDCSRLGGSRHQSWDAWYEFNGCDIPRERRRIVFSDAGLMIEAARRGAGVALARQSLVADHLAAGELVKFDGTPLECVGQTSLIQRRASSRSKASQRVAKWLLDAVSADVA
ncbi:LysR family glycine cleavage system transcriptional activator [Burkholderia pyrrocinia]|uniref:LysR family glycine cleavage system transcriptional activator n=1 Tax=Burkholderia pyrrocinia TaxID=60550 RepID=A0A318JBS5_BURPY|nr:LysR family glycine cleavage system transcriptional activator [Burkholderia pyrrocinia]SFW82402.1 LysR family transcriptional regulator, glycine cleavage system transcriptional activator [Burkholderia sp. NFACC33-1]SFY43990.1 LysR family transcriptional regulator, glycine cleavage system transcriptional activator [Burkholderia sp. NFPP32]